MSASSGSVPTAERRTSVAHGPGTSTTPGSWPAFESGSAGRTYMQPKTRKRVWLIGVPLVVVAGTAGFIWGGRYNDAADDMHTKPVHFLLETARESYIVARLGQLDVPSDLDDSNRIVPGAGNYAPMSAGCHLAPSMAETESGPGLHPPPPDPTKHQA